MGERIDIVNAGDLVEVKGKVVEDYGTHRCFIQRSAGAFLGRCAVVVFSGGTLTGDFGGAYVIVASNGRLSLNYSGGETVTLSDSNAVVIDAYEYSNADDNQSITRDPDSTRLGPIVDHSGATDDNGEFFSPGIKINGSPFAGCSSSSSLKQAPRTWLP